MAHNWVIFTGKIKAPPISSIGLCCSLEQPRGNQNSPVVNWWVSTPKTLGYTTVGKYNPGEKMVHSVMLEV